MKVYNISLVKSEINMLDDLLLEKLVSLEEYGYTIDNNSYMNDLNELRRDLSMLLENK
mgnify:CR=1 FL=1